MVVVRSSRLRTLVQKRGIPCACVCWRGVFDCARGTVHKVKYLVKEQSIVNEMTKKLPVIEITFHNVFTRFVRGEGWVWGYNDGWQTQKGMGSPGVSVRLCLTEVTGWASHVSRFCAQHMYTLLSVYWMYTPFCVVFVHHCLYMECGHHYPYRACAHYFLYIACAQHCLCIWHLYTIVCEYYCLQWSCVYFCL